MKRVVGVGMVVDVISFPLSLFFLICVPFSFFSLLYNSGFIERNPISQKLMNIFLCPVSLYLLFLGFTHCVIVEFTLIDLV